MNLRRELTASRDYKDDPRRVCYLSAEYLTGRLLHQNLIALGLYDQVSALASRHNLNITDILEQECDPGLGNGGLGRLGFLLPRLSGSYGPARQRGMGSVTNSDYSGRTFWRNGSRKCQITGTTSGGRKTGTAFSEFPLADP